MISYSKKSPLYLKMYAIFLEENPGSTEALFEAWLSQLFTTTTAEKPPIREHNNSDILCNGEVYSDGHIFNGRYDTLGFTTLHESADQLAVCAFRLRPSTTNGILEMALNYRTINLCAHYISNACIKIQDALSLHFRVQELEVVYLEFELKEDSYFSIKSTSMRNVDVMPSSLQSGDNSEEVNSHVSIESSNWKNGSIYLSGIVNWQVNCAEQVTIRSNLSQSRPLWSSTFINCKILSRFDYITARIREGTFEGCLNQSCVVMYDVDVGALTLHNNNSVTLVFGAFHRSDLFKSISITGNYNRVTFVCREEDLPYFRNLSIVYDAKADETTSRITILSHAKYAKTYTASDKMPPLKAPGILE